MEKTEKTLEEIFDDYPSLLLCKSTLPTPIPRMIAAFLPFGSEWKKKNGWTKLFLKMKKPPSYRYRSPILLQYPFGNDFRLMVYRFPPIGAGVQTIDVEDWDDFDRYRPYEEQLVLARTPRYIELEDPDYPLMP